jgi:phosphoribosylamine-glycine ligase
MHSIQRSTCVSYHQNADKFDFTPETFILPEDYTEFYSFYNVRKQQQLNTLWIVKPNSLAQGKGIYIVPSLIRCPNPQKL